MNMKTKTSIGLLVYFLLKPFLFISIITAFILSSSGCLLCFLRLNEPDFSVPKSPIHHLELNYMWYFNYLSDISNMIVYNPHGTDIIILEFSSYHDDFLLFGKNNNGELVKLSEDTPEAWSLLKIIGKRGKNIILCCFTLTNNKKVTYLNVFLFRKAYPFIDRIMITGKNSGVFFEKGSSIPENDMVVKFHDYSSIFHADNSKDFFNKLNALKKKEEKVATGI